MTPKTPIAGWLAADLAWIIAAVGLSVTAAAGVALERLVRRRERADRDALTSRSSTGPSGPWPRACNGRCSLVPAGPPDDIALLALRRT